MTCEVPEFYDTTERKARREHKCCECGMMIHVGEKYLDIVGKWDGEVSQFRQHLRCADACEMIRDTIDGECIPFGYLFDWYGEVPNHTRRTLPPAFRSLIASILRRCRESREAGVA